MPVALSFMDMVAMDCTRLADKCQQLLPNKGESDVASGLLREVDLSSRTPGARARIFLEE